MLSSLASAESGSSHCCRPLLLPRDAWKAAWKSLRTFFEGSSARLELVWLDGMQRLDLKKWVW